MKGVVNQFKTDCFRLMDEFGMHQCITMFYRGLKRAHAYLIYLECTIFCLTL